MRSILPGRRVASMDVYEEGFGLLLPRATREALWARLGERIEAYTQAVPGLRVAPGDVKAAIAASLAPYDFQAPRDPVAVLDEAAHMLEQFLLHTSHPAYFGVFNPQAAT